MMMINIIIMRMMQNEHGEEKSLTGERITHEFLSDSPSPWSQIVAFFFLPIYNSKKAIKLYLWYFDREGTYTSLKNKNAIFVIVTYLCIYQGALLDARQCHHIHTIGRLSA